MLSAIHQVLDAIVSESFFFRYVHLPDPDRVPDQISGNSKFYPYFKDCLAAVDGTHFAEFCSAEDAVRKRNRKGKLQ